MQQIYLHSEQYSRDGSIAADGAKRLLGQPSGLTELELVIRESLQNSWDASLDSGFNPRYSIRIRKLNTTQKEALSNFYREMPPKDVDEPVYKTILRDLKKIGYKISFVALPKKHNNTE